MDMDIDRDSTPTVEAGQTGVKPKDDDLDLFPDIDARGLMDTEGFGGLRTVPMGTDILEDLTADSPRQYMLFYRHFFPAKAYFQWLNYDPSPIPSKSFMNREFSFHLVDETFMRFQSFRTLDEFKKELIRMCPSRIDLGAVYNIRPKDKAGVRANAFVAVSKEMVFDIDMTDYDEIRTCCSGGDVCVNCWEFMTIAMKIIDAALRDDFGFKHLLWVYSGRRGVHCWVGDERARVMTNDQRKAIVSYLEVVKGGAQQARRVKLQHTLHPSLSRAYDILQEHFRNLAFTSQDILRTPQHWEKVLAMIPDEDVQARVRKAWEDAPTRAPSLKWDVLETVVDKVASSSPKKAKELRDIPRDIMFQLAYPRLDEKVSTDIRHLLKSPFCIHPKTGRVCVPIPIESCESFDPTSPPTVRTLVEELHKYDAAGDKPKVPDWQKTSLKEHVEVFERFVKGIQKDIADKKRKEAAKSMDF
ncbi:MAG: hypothetical protein J3Q66DRAFT_380297 [Benniella sp.]|nr:MAG: hypothetical protein J3Q66DRAFT_380297 [Benniella sp.]